MSRRTENAAFAKQVEPVKQEECLEFDDEEEEEEEEEEVEYEEIEEEIEEEEEVEVEEDPEEIEGDARHGSGNKMEGVPRQDSTKDGNDKEKHAELLALPAQGSEVYIGGISSDASSEDLKKLCEPVGEVVEVRIMQGKGKDSRGYAFVTFRTKDLASEAIQKLNNTTLKGKRIRVSSSQAKNKLFIGNLPHNWTHDDFKKAVEEVGPGVLKLDLIKDTRTDRNRGYGFVEYYNNACAEYSRQKMSDPKFKLDTNSPNVSWADAKNVDSSSTSQVKSVYVKNLPKNVTQGQLKKLFEHHGEITKIVLPPSKDGHDNRYGFVHFKDRNMAMKAVKNTEHYELDGQLLDCSLAKPPSEKKDDTASVSNTKGGQLLHAPLRYGIMPRADAYGAPPAGIAQPMLYAPGAPPGAAMLPMLLPDGRLVYVVQQQPAGQQHYASPPPQARHHYASPPQARQVGRYGSSGGSGSGGSSRSGTKRHRDDSSRDSRNRGRNRPY